MRLSISNSRSVIFCIIVFNAIITILIFEYLYSKRNVPVFYGRNNGLLIESAKNSIKKNLLILGDSRAEAGIVPEIIDSESNYDSFNLGREGIYKGYFYGLIRNNLYPNKVIVAVSPYSLFNNFKIKEKLLDNSLFNELNFQKYLNYFRKPNKNTENYLNGIVNRNTHLNYGLSGILDLIMYGEVSEYYSPKGWHKYDRLGSDEFYTYMINLESYKSRIIEEYKDSSKIIYGKSNFDNLLSSLVKNNITAVFVRVPTSNEIRLIEDSKYPWFSEYINNTVNSYGYNYHDFVDFKYPENNIDGSHLNEEGARIFTNKLVQIIKQ